MKKFLSLSWPYLLCAAIFFLILSGIDSSCSSRRLKKENEQLREELARQQAYVPLKRDTIRDTVAVVTQQVVEVEKVKNVLTAEEKALLKDLQVKVSEIETMQKTAMESAGQVHLAPDTATSGGIGDSVAVLGYRDEWCNFKYNTLTDDLTFHMKDSLVAVVRRQYKHHFLWWRWKVKGYELKLVNFNPYSTIHYNTFIQVE